MYTNDSHIQDNGSLYQMVAKRVVEYSIKA